MDVTDDTVIDLAGEYDILGELGRGGSAIVYHARDRQLGREVAIKVVRPRFSVDDDESLQRLSREARTVANLQHPNIVTVHSVRRLTDGGLALVMQMVPGRTLKQTIVDGGPLPHQTAEAVIRDVASALAFAHSHGVVHRDVKPENIFLDATSGRALLSDFGIAHNIEFDSRLTMTGTAIGTPAYMSPEQIDGKPTDPRSDVYSLGLVAWEMLTGERPWEGETLYNVIYRQKHDELPAIDSIRPGVPRRLQYLIERMLQKRPAARWAGADGVLAFMSASVLPADWAQWESAHKRRREREKAAAAAATVPAGFVSSALATIRFRRSDVERFSKPAPGARPASSDSAAASSLGTFIGAGDPLAPGGPTGSVTLETPSATRDGTSDDEQDAAPTWMREAPARRGVWPFVMAGAAVLLVAGGAFATIASRRTATRAIQAPRADVAAIEVPIRPDAPRDSSVASDSVTAPDAIGALGSTAVAAATVGVAASPGTGAAAGLDAFVSGRGLRRRGVRGAALPPASAAGAGGLPDQSAGTTVPATVSAAASGELALTNVRATDDRSIVAAGGRHSCALDGGRVLCWGANDRGQLGDGEVEAHSVPAPVVGDLLFASVTAGIAHSCGITRSGDAYCWGSDESGQLGDATTTSRSAPVRVGSNLTFRSIRTGLAHTCALANGGTVACWGSNAMGQLGDNSTANRSSPVTVDARVRFISVATGWNHSCALTTDGVAYCWGDNGAGQLGDGTKARHTSPTPVAATVRFTSIAAGSAHTCAVSDAGEAYCWGRNTFGQLGTADVAEHPTPTRVETAARFLSVSAGSVHSCARASGGAVYCWGRNLYGQLGDGSNTDRATPVRVLSSTSFTALNVTGAHSCATSAAGETYCWGFNTDGQLGDGTRNHRSRPTRVVVPER